MASTTFVDGETLIEASWLNDVNAVVYTPGTSTAADIANVPAGNIAATDVQAALNELDTEKQPISGKLTDIAALAVTDSNIIVGNGTTWVAESGATARASLGINTGTDIAEGLLELATSAETITGTDTTRAVTPAGMSARFANTGVQTITAGGALTIAHPLGVVPKLAVPWLTCQTGELGYTAGDKLLASIASSADISKDYGVSIVCDASNIYIRYGSNANSFLLTRKDTGAQSAITNARWKFSVEVLA